MTTPNQPSPDKAHVIDDPDPYGIGRNYAQGWTEDDVEEAVTGEARRILEDAADGFSLWKNQTGATLALASDSQLNLNNRLDLLQDIQGYGCAFMQYNWDMPYQSWVVVPFERQLGPILGAEVSDRHGGSLCLKKGGLWRVDSHMTIQGWTQFVQIVSVNPFLTQTYEGPIVASYQLQVLDAQNNLYTSKRYDAPTWSTGNPTYGSIPPGSSVNHPSSSAWNHTFVLDIPDEENPDDWYYVRMSAYFTFKANAIYGLPTFTFGKLIGGTSQSALIATRWSKDEVEFNYMETVTDGGTL